MDTDDEKFFYEDEVAMISSKSGLIKYGLVLNTNRTRSEIDLKKSTYRSPDEIKVIWHPTGIEEIIKDDKVMLMDRSLMPGDVVRKVSDSTPNQFGYCENINMFATVKILNTNKVIENINSRNFTLTKPFPIDSSVFYESWVGGIYDVKSKVTFTSQDGSIFTLEDPFRQDFISLSTSDSFSAEDNVFYPGQKFKMSIDSLENAKFITTTNYLKCLWQSYKKKYSHKLSIHWIKVYVQDISILSVEVEWYCQTSNRTKRHEERCPERIIQGDDLKKLKTIDLFESCSIQIGDTHWYTIKDTDKLLTMKQWHAKCTTAFNFEPSWPLSSKNKKDGHLNKHLSIKNPSKNKNLLELDNVDDLLYDQNLSNQNISTVQIQKPERILIRENKSTIHTKNYAPKPSSNSSIHTMKSNRLKRYRKWKSLVKKKKPFNVPKVSTRPNSKVVVEICYTKSLIDVIWQDGTRERGVSSTDLYPVQTLDDLEFFPGDFVTEKNPPSDVYGVIESVDHAERTVRVQWFKVDSENPSLPKLIEKTDFSVYDLCDHPDFHYKTGCLIIHISHDTNPDSNALTAGQVLCAGSDGRILVMWVNGEKTHCWPQELFIVKLNDDDDDDGFSFQDEEYENDDNHEENDINDDDDDNNYVTHEYQHDYVEYDDDNNSDNDLIVVDDVSSEDWISVTNCGSSNTDLIEKDGFIKLLNEFLKQAQGMKLFLDQSIGQNQDKNKFIEFKIALDQIRLGIVELPFPKITEIKTSFNDCLNNITTFIDEIILKKDDIKGIDKDLAYKSLIEDSFDQLQNTVSSFKDFNQASKILINYNNKSSKLSDKEDQSVYVKRIIPATRVLPITIIDPTECVSMDTNTETEYEVIAKPEEAGVFDIVETLLDGSHKFITDDDNVQSTMLKIINKDIQILQKSLPAGIWVKTFENRMDLFSVMIRGPENTPYAGGLFLFDIKVPLAYPNLPPHCYYYSFCDERLNPNLYEDGKVCLSLLGTWTGHGVELWSPKNSNLLQLLVSIQGLILVSEPYYNEAGFDSQRGQKLANENSRVYNEMVLIKVVQSMKNILTMNHLQIKSTGYFKEEILEHVKCHGPKLINTIENWIKMSSRELTEEEKLLPGFPLLPLSKGFCLSINKALKDYKDTLISMNVMFK